MDIKHSQKPSKVVFLSEDEFINELHDLEKDEKFDTSPIAVHENGTSQLISFFARHSTYLRTHPKVNPEIYLSNLRTMIRKRRP